MPQPRLWVVRVALEVDERLLAPRAAAARSRSGCALRDVHELAVGRCVPKRTCLFRSALFNLVTCLVLIVVLGAIADAACT